MDVTERDRLTAAMIALRPDWACNGFDRHKSIRTWLTEHAMEWTYRDAIVRMLLCAIEPTTVTPARALTDGPWLDILRHVSSESVTAKMPGYAQLEPECGYPGCGVRRDRHLAHVVPAEIPPHVWESPRPVVAASAESIQRARPLFGGKPDELPWLDPQGGLR